MLIHPYRESRSALEWATILVALLVLNVWLWVGNDFNRDRAVAKYIESATSKAPSKTYPTLSVTDDSTEEDKIAGDLEQLESLLQNRQHEAAVELYRILYDQLSEAESKKYKDTIFSFAEKLYALEEHRAVLELVSRYAYIFYRDLMALNMLADSQHGLGLYSAEIETLFSAIDEAYLKDDIVLLKTKLKDAAKAQAMVLIKANESSKVIELYQSVLTRVPESISMRIGLSRAFISAGKIDEAVVVLNELPRDPEYRDEIDHLLRITQYVNLK